MKFILKFIAFFKLLSYRLNFKADGNSLKTCSTCTAGCYMTLMSALNLCSYDNLAVSLFYTSAIDYVLAYVYGSTAS